MLGVGSSYVEELSWLSHEYTAILMELKQEVPMPMLGLGSSLMLGVGYSYVEEF